MIATDLARPPRGGSVAAIARGSDDRAELRMRIVDAALAEIAEVGVSRMTMESVAARAGVSRATLYRAFPGGRDPIVAAVVEVEVARHFTLLAAELSVAEDLRSVLVAAICRATNAVTEHAALARVLEVEPELVTSKLEFAAMDALLAQASMVATPFLSRWLAPEDAARAAELAVRIVVSYLLSPADGLNLADEADAGALVDRFVLPGLRALANVDRSTATVKQ